MLIPEDKRSQEDWLFGRVGLRQFRRPDRSVPALELHPPRVNHYAPYAWLYKPELLGISGRSFTFGGLERSIINGHKVWVQQCWICAYADDTQFMNWIRSLKVVPDWAVLLGPRT